MRRYLWLAVLVGCGDEGATQPTEDAAGIDAPAAPVGCLDSLDRGYALHFVHARSVVRADTLDIEAGGVQYFEDVTALRTDSSNDSGNNDKLEVHWIEGGSKRLNFELMTDGADWWLDQVRFFGLALDQPTLTATDVKCPVGKHFSGRIELASAEGAGLTVRLENVWLRGFVGDDPPGVQVPAIETNVRAFCTNELACMEVQTVNACIGYYGHALGASLRVDAHAAVASCLAAAPCMSDPADAACWMSSAPARLPYHDAFVTRCQQVSAGCEPDIYPICDLTDRRGWASLSYFSEAIVQEASACLPDGASCIAIETCLHKVGERHHWVFVSPPG